METTRFGNSFQIGMKSVRATFVPMLVLWTIAVGVSLSYCCVPAFASAVGAGTGTRGRCGGPRAHGAMVAGKERVGVRPVGSSAQASGCMPADCGVHWVLMGYEDFYFHAGPLIRKESGGNF